MIALDIVVPQSFSPTCWRIQEIDLNAVAELLSIYVFRFLALVYVPPKTVTVSRDSTFIIQQWRHNNLQCTFIDTHREFVCWDSWWRNVHECSDSSDGLRGLRFRRHKKFLLWAFCFPGTARRATQDREQRDIYFHAKFSVRRYN